MKILPELKDKFNKIPDENKLQYTLAIILAAGTTYVWFIKILFL
ncbi:hypothetical protein [Desertivirga brevis]|nr:hypothetical protein [Pedobacter sp. SYSU D00873]